MADEPLTESGTGSAARKKACTECRQQKAKCDAHLKSNDACSRCKKMGTQCVISAPFRRENKRQRLSELEREADTLRKRLRSEDSQPPYVDHAQVIGNDDNGVPPVFEAPPNFSEAQTNASASMIGGVVPAAVFDAPQPLALSGNQTRTTSQTLGQVTVSAKDIDSIFNLFFSEYSPWLPILDARLPPNVYYQQSPLLFWAVIGTACRSYTQNPTLMNALTKDIVQSALLSVTSSRAPLQRLQAFLLLVTWPLADAVETDQQETIFVLVGLLLHLGLRSGLHVPSGSDEFFRVKMPNLPDIGMAGRAELWTHCVLAYQRICLCKGFVSRTSFDISPETERHQAQHDTISASLKLRSKWQNICVQCGSAASEIGLRNLTPEQDRALSVVVRTFDSQISQLELQTKDDSDQLECQIGRLYIRSFYFLKEDQTSYPETFNMLQNTARQIITAIEKLIRKTQNPISIPYYVVCAFLFASYTLLRILKSSITLPPGEYEEAKSALFLAIGYMKQISNDPNDMCSRSVVYLTQLWNSTKAFKKPDGSDMFKLRARSRMNGSHVVDALIWWREEFDPNFKVQMQSMKNSALVSMDSSNADAQAEVANTQQHDQQRSTDFNFNFFDFDCFMGAELSYPPDLLNFPGVDASGLHHG